MRTLLAATSTLAILTSAFAQDATLPRRTSVPFPPQSLLASQWQPGATLTDVLNASRRAFRELDANGDGQLSRADAEVHEAVARAQSRSAHANYVMAYDLDGDGHVTENEIRTKQLYDRRSKDDAYTQAAEAAAEAELRRVLAADANKDGRITSQEALDSWTATPNAAAQVTAGLSAHVREALAAASKPDGALNTAEFEELFAQRFRAADTDGNGTLSQEEARLYQTAKARADCVIPKASGEAKVVLWSSYEARGLSTVTIGSQEVEVRTGRITIETGIEPLYLIVLSHSPVIWRFDGATERIERVILGSNTPQPNTSASKKPIVGATGLSASKVQFLPRYDCLQYFSETPSTSAATATALVRSDTGKEPIVAAHYGVSSFSVPSGQVPLPQNTAGGEKPALVIQKQFGTLKVEGGANVSIQTAPANLISDVNRIYSSGVTKIDPESVTASGKVEPYEVLPSQAGLLQLVSSGALDQNRSGEFLIKQKIRFPAGLTGGRSARFLLLRGVPTPDGNPGHSCVISEETGQPILSRGASCR
jgi:hypothetical protein